MFRSCFKKLKTSALFFFALLLSVSSLVNLASFVIEPAFADNKQKLCELTATPGSCNNVVLVTTGEGDDETPINPNSPLLALKRSDQYYLAIGTESYDKDGKKQFDFKNGQMIRIFVSTKSDFSDTLASIDLGETCSADAQNPSDCGIDTTKYHVYIYNGSREIDCSEPGACYGKIRAALNSQGVDPIVSYNLNGKASRLEITISDDGKTASIKEIDEDGGETESIQDTGDDSNGAQPAEAAATCNTAAGGLGWFLCTVLDGLAKFIQWLYDNAVKPALVIDTKLLVWNDGSGENTSGTLSAWSTFRDFANILFVIYLLVVIFSQLTGVGIDNYGIKKTLPKLIAAAILVNLSYIICQLAVDLSNIVGSSLYNLLTNIPVTVPEEIVDENSVTIVSGLASTGITMAVAGAIVGGTIFASGGSLLAAGLGLLIPLAGTILGAVVGLVFMFFLLGMRQALVVILVALAPLAFVCYMLPNTKNIFDRWLNILKAMLLLYPICSVVIGGGQLASKIILASGGASGSFFILFTAMIAEIGPFFLVPSLVKGAYRATGELGMRLNRFSGGLGIGARRAFFGSRFARNTQQAAALKRSEAISKNYEKNLGRAANNGTKVFDRAARTLGRFGTSASSQKEAAEARKQLIAAAQAQNEINKLTSGATTDAEGNNITVNGELTTQGNAVVQAQIQQANISAANQVQDMLQYNNEQFAKGKLNQAAVSRDRDLQTAQLFARDDYKDSRISQNAAAISNETTRMYADRYANMSGDNLKNELTQILTSAAPEYTSDRSERFSAAISTLMSQGSDDKILDVLSGNGGANASSFYNFMSATNTSDPNYQSQVELRNSVAQTFLSSGNTILKEYGKNLASNDANKMKDFNSFVTGGGNDTLKSALEKKGDSALVGMNKDNLDFIKRTMDEQIAATGTTAFSSLSDKMFTNAFASTSNGEEIKRLSEIASNLDATKRASIIQSMSAAQFVNTNDAIRKALIVNPNTRDRGGLEYVNQALQLSKPENAQLAAKLSDAERSFYHIS